MNKVFAHRNLSILFLIVMIGLGAAFFLPWMAVAQSQAAGIKLEPNTESAPGVDPRYYVAKSGDGSDGLSWSTAFTNVQDALAAASDPAEIWVAEGVYYPDIGSGQINNSISSTFVMTDGVSLIGGFNFGDTDIADQDPENNVTVLSGDIDWDNGGADITDVNGVVITTTNLTGNNAYHVVTGSGVTNTAVLDGFTITAGQANGNTSPPCGPLCGGGMYNDNGSPVVVNVTFSGNSADAGGGMYNYNSSPALTNVSFSGNSACYGGGMANGESSPILTNVSFSGNSSCNRGGGMSNESSSSPVLTNVTFSGNSAGNQGGGMYNNNGSPALTSSPALTNVTFSGNSAGNQGGGIYNQFDSSPLIRNTILWNNQDSSGTDTISATIFLTNTSSTTITHSLVQGSKPGGIWIGGSYVDGGDNIDQDPLFVLPIDPSTAPTTAGDLRLKVDSPAIDKGNNNYVPFGVTTDLAGDERIVDGSFLGVARVDMGAYEYQTHYLLTVTRTGTGIGKVTSTPPGIDCGEDCSSLFPNGISVTLTAATAPGSKFTGWSNDCTGSETCVVKMDRSRKVFANFDELLQQIFLPVIFR